MFFSDVVKSLKSPGGLNLIQKSILKTNGSNIKNEFGENPLHVACEEGDIGIVKMLIEECSIDPNATENYEGKTALHFACRRGRTVVVRYLVEDVIGVDPNIQDNNGCTPFDHAFLCGQLDVIRYLIQKIAQQSGYEQSVNSSSLAEQFIGCMKTQRSGVSLENVLFISREHFLAFKKIPEHGVCKTKKNLINGSQIPPNKKILFVTHRWSDPKNPDPNGHKFAMIAKFLACDGPGSREHIDYLWIDYSCLPPNEEVYLNNVTTALLASTHCLVVPSVRKIQYNDKHVECTDLCNLLGRAWCKYEVLVSLLGGCEVFCAYLFKDPDKYEEFEKEQREMYFIPVKDEYQWNEELMKGGNLFKASSLEVINYLFDDPHTVYVALWDLWLYTDNFFGTLENLAELVISLSKENRPRLKRIWAGSTDLPLQQALYPFISQLGGTLVERDLFFIASNLICACSFLMNRVGNVFDEGDEVPTFYQRSRSQSKLSSPLTTDYEDFLDEVSPRQTLSMSRIATFMEGHNRESFSDNEGSTVSDLSEEIKRQGVNEETNPEKNKNYERQPEGEQVQPEETHVPVINQPVVESKNDEENASGINEANNSDDKQGEPQQAPVVQQSKCCKKCSIM